VRRRKYLVGVLVVVVVLGSMLGLVSPAFATEGDLSSYQLEASVSLELVDGQYYSDVQGGWRFSVFASGTARVALLGGSTWVSLEHSYMKDGVEKPLALQVNNPSSQVALVEAGVWMVTFNPAWSCGTIYISTKTVEAAQQAFDAGRWVMKFNDGSPSYPGLWQALPTPEHPFTEIHIVSITATGAGFLVTVTGWGFLAAPGELLIKDATTTPGGEAPDETPVPWHWSENQLDFFLAENVTDGTKILRVTNTLDQYDECAFVIGGVGSEGPGTGVFAGIGPLDVVGMLKRLFWPQQDHRYDLPQIYYQALARFPFSLVVGMTSALSGSRDIGTAGSPTFTIGGRNYTVSPTLLGAGWSSGAMAVVTALLWVGFLIGALARYLPRF